MKEKKLIPRLNNFEGVVLWKKRAVNTSDGAEYKRNQKYEANRIERIIIEQWKTGRPLLLLKCSMTHVRYALTIRSW